MRSEECGRCAVYGFAPIESVTEEDFRAITGVLSRQLGARKIRVNTLNPGMVESVSQLTSYRSSCSWPRTILLVDRRGMPAATCTERRGTPAAVHPRARMRLRLCGRSVGRTTLLHWYDVSALGQQAYSSRSPSRRQLGWRMAREIKIAPRKRNSPLVT